MAVYYLVVSVVEVSGRRILIYYQSIARYLGLVVNTIAYWQYILKPVLKSPSLSYKDVTIIILTISTNVKELRQIIQSILAYYPF
jgi:hypothetical protein